MTKLWIATAWAKQSGLGRIRPAVAEFAARGGTSEVIVGIDEGGASREGLRLCLELFDSVFIYHDPGTRTFHPKIYAVESLDRAVLAVGSGNLTKGGLFTNYEAAFVLDVARNVVEEWQLRGDVRAYFDRLLNAGEAIRPLDEKLIARLEAEGWVTSEAHQHARRSAQSRERREREPLFGIPVGGLAGAPLPDLPPLPAEEEDEDSALPSLPLPVAGPPPGAFPPAAPSVPAPAVVHSWNKVMTHADAQHPERHRTNPTGRLALGQAGHEIDHRTWFRDVLFGAATWASEKRSGKQIEVATIPVDVSLGGVPQGTQNLALSHSTHRESTRGSVLTILHWGILAPLLRATDYTGHTVTIFVLSDDTYRLDIA